MVAFTRRPLTRGRSPISYPDTASDAFLSRVQDHLPSRLTPRPTSPSRGSAAGRPLACGTSLLAVARAP